MIARFLMALLLVCVAGVAHAQYRIDPSGCHRAGAAITVAGTFTRAQSGQIVVAVGQRGLPVRIQRWTSTGVRGALPRASLDAGERYRLLWIQPGAGQTALGVIMICGSTSSTDGSTGARLRIPDRQTATPPPNRTRAGADVVPAPDRSPEYAVIVGTGQANAAQTALEGAGATLLRTRNLPALGQTILLFAFPGNLTLPQAQGLLPPGATVDLHHIYRLSSGPRVFAAAMIGDDPNRSCQLARSVRVGVLDGAVNPGHPALRGASVSRKSVLSRGERPVSPDHGTAVTALIGAPNAAGPLAGFASGAGLYVAEAFSNDRGPNGARLENIAAGLDWFIGQRVQIVNLSFAGPYNRTFQRLLSLSANKGLIMVAAAGNDKSSGRVLPASAQETIAVTAVDANAKLYSRANFGNHIEFAAPGVDLYAAKGSGAKYQSGTSFAAPVVTAMLARASARGGLSLDRARSYLRRSVRDLGAPGRDPKFGYGLIQSQGC